MWRGVSSSGNPPQKTPQLPTTMKRFILLNQGVTSSRVSPSWRCCTEVPTGVGDRSLGGGGGGGSGTEGGSTAPQPVQRASSSCTSSSVTACRTLHAGQTTSRITIPTSHPKAKGLAASLKAQ